MEASISNRNHSSRYIRRPQMLAKKAHEQVIVDQEDCFIAHCKQKKGHRPKRLISHFEATCCVESLPIFFGAHAATTPSI